MTTSNMSARQVRELMRALGLEQNSTLDLDKVRKLNDLVNANEGSVLDEATRRSSTEAVQALLAGNPSASTLSRAIKGLFNSRLFTAVDFPALIRAFTTIPQTRVDLNSLHPQMENALLFALPLLGIGVQAIQPLLDARCSPRNVWKKAGVLRREGNGKDKKYLDLPNIVKTSLSSAGFLHPVTLNQWGFLL